MENYFEWKHFNDIYLEDSYVLEIIESDTNLVFKMELVLLENNPLYTTPLPNEQYCYYLGKIEFRETDILMWIDKNKISPSIDLNNEIDYGNIDALYKEGDIYFIEGDFGKISLRCKELSLIYLSL
ncbi:MAG: hypothetical protein H6Q20_1939 [Bacteroidetes bacterium]|nr:hypothetical protein [Bacteroidota bacterium]